MGKVIERERESKIVIEKETIQEVYVSCVVLVFLGYSQKNTQKRFVGEVAKAAAVDVTIAIKYDTISAAFILCYKKRSKPESV